MQLGTYIHNLPGRLSPSPHLHHNENDDGNHEKYQKKSGIKAGAENVTDQFTPGHGDHQEKKN